MSNKENEKGQLPPEGFEKGKESGAYNNSTLKDWIRLAFWIALVVALGMLAVNQTFEFYYKAEFLKAPCNLCGELNPEVGLCLQELNTHASYWTNEGWTDPTSNTTPEYQIKIIE